MKSYEILPADMMGSGLSGSDAKTPKTYEILPGAGAAEQGLGGWAKGGAASAGVTGKGVTGFGLPYDPMGVVTGRSGKPGEWMGRPKKGYEILPGAVGLGTKGGGCGGGCGCGGDCNQAKTKPSRSNILMPAMDSRVVIAGANILSFFERTGYPMPIYSGPPANGTTTTAVDNRAGGDCVAYLDAMGRANRRLKAARDAVNALRDAVEACLSGTTLPDCNALLNGPYLSCIGPGGSQPWCHDFSAIAAAITACTNHMPLAPKSCTDLQHAFVSAQAELELAVAGASAATDAYGLCQYIATGRATLDPFYGGYSICEIYCDVRYRQERVNDCVGGCREPNRTDEYGRPVLGVIQPGCAARCNEIYDRYVADCVRSCQRYLW